VRSVVYTKSGSHLKTRIRTNYLGKDRCSHATHGEGTHGWPCLLSYF